jgi:hypothetical protein
MLRSRTALLLSLLLTSKADASGQAPNPIRVAVGFGVDTSGLPNHDIFSLWRSYLQSRPDSIRPTGAWSPAEQERWPQFDLLSGFVYQGFPHFTVVYLAPAVGFDSTYVIRTLVSQVSDSVQDVKPLALYRVYATREDGRWVLANALPRLTRAWRHETIGRVTFVFPETRSFSRVRAAQSSAFVDSLAQAFGIRPPRSVDYYFTDDLMETLRAAGLDFFPLGADTVGGRSWTSDHLVLVGSSSNGEGYRHELSHVVLQNALVGHETAPLVSEGLMTWTGGSAGVDFKRLMPSLNRYLEAHPDLTLERLLADPPRREGMLDPGYDGLAVLCQMIYAAKGIPGIRDLTGAGREPRAVVTTAARLLGIGPSELDGRWRNRVAQLAR